MSVSFARLLPTVLAVVIVEIAGALLARPASSDERFTIAGWIGGSFPRRGGAFTHCAMSRNLSSRFFMYFSLRRNSYFSLTIYDRDGKFSAAASAGVTLWIDRRKVGEGMVHFLDRHRLQFALPRTSATFQSLRTGHRLDLDVDGKVIPISLAGTAAALERLRQCVFNRLDVEAGRPPRYLVRRRTAPGRATAPGGGDVANRVRRRATDGQGTGSTASSGAGDASRRLEAVTYVANLLARAGFRQYRILQRKEMRKQAGSGYDVVWRTRSSIGALRIYAGLEAKDFDGLAAKAIVAGAQTCKGGFRSGVKRDANSPVLRFFTQCDGDAGWHALYALVRGKGDRVYLVLSLGNGLSDTESGAGLREIDNRIVKAITARPLD